MSFIRSSFPVRIKPRTLASLFHIALAAGVLREVVVSSKGALPASKPCGQPELQELRGITIGQSFPQSPGRTCGGR